MTEHEHTGHEHLVHGHAASVTRDEEHPPLTESHNTEPPKEKGDLLSFKFSINKNKIMPWLLLILLAIVAAQTVQLIDVKFKLKTALSAPVSGAQIQAASVPSDSASSLPSMVGGC